MADSVHGVGEGGVGRRVRNQEAMSVVAATTRRTGPRIVQLADDFDPALELVAAVVGHKTNVTTMCRTIRSTPS